MSGRPQTRFPSPGQAKTPPGLPSLQSRSLHPFLVHPGCWHGEKAETPRGSPSLWSCCWRSWGRGGRWTQDTHTRATRDSECVNLAVGLPVGKSGSQKAQRPSGESTRAPSGGDAGSSPGGQKQTAPGEAAVLTPTKAPFVRRHSPEMSPLPPRASSELSSPELTSPGPGDFPLCSPSRAENCTLARSRSERAYLSGRGGHRSLRPA